MNFIRNVKLWRFFALISFANQVLRIPLLLSLAPSTNVLEPYFIIAALCIPIQFISNDILQFRSKLNELSQFELFLALASVVFSIGYVVFEYGIEMGYVSIAFGIGLVVYGVSTGMLRHALTPVHVIAFDSFFNTSVTMLLLLILVNQSYSSNIGYLIILCQPFVAILFGLLIYLYLRCERMLQNEVPGETKERSSNATLLLTGVMISTQLERLVISACEPILLACISIAAGITQAWRKIGMEDSIVYSRLRMQRNGFLDKSMSSELRHARLVFFSPLPLVFIAFWNVTVIYGWVNDHGLLSLLTISDYYSILSILSVYLLSMPAGIVGINVLRIQGISVKNLGFFILIMLVAIELIALFFAIKLSDEKRILSMSIIWLTSFLNFALFIATYPKSCTHGIKLLRWDITLFILNIVMLSWLNLFYLL
jgi:hypothetical protein